VLATRVAALFPADTGQLRPQRSRTSSVILSPVQYLGYSSEYVRDQFGISKPGHSIEIFRGFDSRRLHN
jgi:hypothetical protein